MKTMQTTFVAIATVLLLGTPVATSQTKAPVVDAVVKETTLRGWEADNALRFAHPTRPEDNAILAQCFQSALASGAHPKIEAAFLANKAYIEARIPRAIAYAMDPENKWNELESTYLTFQLMNQGEDAKAQSQYFTYWIVGWGNSFGDDTSEMKVSDIDYSAQAAVEAMYSACATTGEEKRTITQGETEEALEPVDHNDKVLITWEADILPGGLDAMRALAKQWEVIAARDPNTLYSKWVIKEDGTAVRLDSLFVDAESSQAQFPKNLWHRLDVLTEEKKIDPTAMVISGRLSEYTEFLRDFGAHFMVPVVD